MDVAIQVSLDDCIVIGVVMAIRCGLTLVQILRQMLRVMHNAILRTYIDVWSIFHHVEVSDRVLLIDDRRFESLRRFVLLVPNLNIFIGYHSSISSSSWRPNTRNIEVGLLFLILSFEGWTCKYVGDNWIVGVWNEVIILSFRSYVSYRVLNLNLTRKKHWRNWFMHKRLPFNDTFSCICIHIHITEIVLSESEEESEWNPCCL